MRTVIIIALSCAVAASKPAAAGPLYLSCKGTVSNRIGDDRTSAVESLKIELDRHLFSWSVEPRSERVTDTCSNDIRRPKRGEWFPHPELECTWAEQTDTLIKFRLNDPSSYTEGDVNGITGALQATRMGLSPPANNMTERFWSMNCVPAEKRF